MNLGLNSGARKGYTVSASYRTPTVLLIYSSSVKVLAVIEERNHLRKK